MFLIIKKTEEGGWPSPYCGAVVIMNGFPYFVTAWAEPTLFETFDAAGNEYGRLLNEFNDTDFQILSVSEYLSTIKRDGRFYSTDKEVSLNAPSWLKELKNKIKSLKEELKSDNKEVM